MASLKENGGILREGTLPIPCSTCGSDRRLFDRCQEQYRYLPGRSSYGMPSKASRRGFFGHCLERSSVSSAIRSVQPFLAQVHRYEERDGEGGRLKPYEHWYIQSTASRSTFESLLSNKVFVQLQRGTATAW